MYRMKIIGIVLTLSALVILIYAFFVEPYWIEKKVIQFSTELSKRYSVAQLSDIHMKEYSRKEKDILKSIASYKPDFIVLTGDLVSPRSKIEDVIAFLKDLKSVSPVIVVSGNWEIWELPKLEELEMYKKADVLYLANKSYLVDNELCFLGLDDIEGSPSLSEALIGCENSLFKLALFHSPEWFDQVLGEAFHLGLAGHTHGGQIRLPFFTPITPPGSANYISGLYKKKNMQMYVSRGLGQSIIPARFFARPEIVFIELLKK